MIIVTGSVRARPDGLDELLTVCVEHVHRSRTERGCLLHSVHQNVEDRSVLVFLEHWEDRDALAEHFAQPDSLAFVRELTELAAERPTMSIYEASLLER